MKHIAIAIDNSTSLKALILSINCGQSGIGIEGIPFLVYNQKAVENFISEEVKHDNLEFKKTYGQTLQSMSSGEQKIRFLKELFATLPKGLILENPLAHLDSNNSELVKNLFEKHKSQTSFVLLLKKFDWIPDYISEYYTAFGNSFKSVPTKEDFLKLGETSFDFRLEIPKGIEIPVHQGELISMKNIRVSYEGKQVLNGINWTLKQGDYWELRGPNGSGKTTLLSMLTGENPMGYGQDLHLFGYKKGSGESIWDIKKNIGYYTPFMTAFFTGYYSVEEMIIGGLKDSIGLYQKPSKLEQLAVSYWIKLIGLADKKEAYFTDLSLGEQSLVMIARAMVKMPKLLILDEPTAGLDHASNQLFISLVNEIAKAHQVTIVFVSHKREPHLKADKVFELIPNPNGSTYKILE